MKKKVAITTAVASTLTASTLTASLALANQFAKKVLYREHSSLSDRKTKCDKNNCLFACINGISEVFNTDC